jgi:biotin carboxylase
MKRVVIIGANEFQNPLIEKAKSLGYETHVFAWASGDIGEKTADYFYPISIVEKEKILEECKKIKPDAITSIGSDLAIITVNYVADALGLNCNDPDYSLICTNKFEMRKAFEKANIKVPRFERVKNVDEVTINKFPLIVKPTDRSGSRSIALVHTKEELKKSILKACDSSFEKCAIVEEVIEGKNEYSCESISFKGKHTILAITRKFTTGFPTCIETGHIEPAELPENIKNNIFEIIPKALDALHIKNSASHVEFKVGEDNSINIIEIGARMGGDCIGSHLVEISTGYDFLKMTLDVALGKEPDLEIKNEPHFALIKFIFDRKDLENVKLILNKYPGIYNSSMIDENFNHEVVDSSSRFGYYIFDIKDKNVLQDVRSVLFNE